MDYELVIDLTDAATQTYMTNIQSLLTALIPAFNVHDRDKYFTSIQLKCNLNTLALPDDKLLPALQDLNDTKPITLGGSLVKFKNIQRPSMEQFMKQHKQKNIMHQKRMNKAPNSSPSNPSNPSSPSLSLSNNNNNKKNKNRTFISNNKIMTDADGKQALHSSLPPPQHPNNSNNKEERSSSPPPPPYHEVVSQEQKEQKEEEKKEMAADPEPDIIHIKLQTEQDAKVAQELQKKFYSQPSAQANSKNSKHSNNNRHLSANANVREFGLSDAEWKLQRELLAANNGMAEMKEDESDYALARRIQHEQQREDKKYAMRLQKEEELNLQAKVERARNRYRNPNFVDYGSQAGDYAYHPSYGSGRRQAGDDNEQHINHNYYPQPQPQANSSISSQSQSQSQEGRRAHRWQPSMDEIIMNNGAVPAVFRRMMAQNDEVFDDADDDGMFEAFPFHNAVHQMYGLNLDGLHGHRRRRHVDDSWQRLPTRTLSEKDVAILSKSEEKKSCPVCMADFKTEEVTRQLPCFHEFHKDCVDKWFHQQNEKGKDASCPLDRKKVKDIANQQV